MGRYFFLFFCSVVLCLHSLSNYEYIYPPSVQALVETQIFRGDRHGEFQGDKLSLLTDGSMWKIHPESRSIYSSWEEGDHIRITVRTDCFWFKREHKFALFNHTRGEFAKAMLISHKQDPPLKIVATETYVHSYYPAAATNVIHEYSLDSKPKVYHHVINRSRPSYRKVLSLSDGSTWVIRDKFTEFQLGMNVYVGAQGQPQKFYDFIIIVGNEREAIWTWARPQK